MKPEGKRGVELSMNVIIIAAIALIVLVILILLVSKSASAFSTLSLSKTDFSSNDPLLNKPVWLLTIVEDGNQQSAQGTFDNTAVKASDGSMAKNDLSIAITNTKNACEYNFADSTTPIYSTEYREVSWYSYASSCSAIPGNFYAAREGLTGYCLVRTETARYAPLSTPVNTIASTISVTVNGETQSGTVTNTGTRNVMLGNRVYASWNGNLVSGQQCPNPLDSQVVGIKASNGYVIANKAAYDAYDSTQNDLLSCISAQRTLLPSTEGAKYCVNQYNERSNRVLVASAIQPFAAAQLSASKATITIPALLQYPVITMRVDATWLGVYIPVGKPQIVSVTDVTMNEATTASATVTLKNVGDAMGSFNVAVSCGDSAARVGVTKIVAVPAGQTVTTDVSITGATTGRSVDTSCTATATDVNQPANTASKTFSVTIKPLQLCTPMQERCTDKVIEQCDVEGGKWVQKQTCPNGCVFASGKPSCAEAVGCTTDSQCDDGDITTTDKCVGVLTKTCQHTPAPTFDLLKYWKVMLFVFILVAFIGLGVFVNPWFHIGTGVSALLLMAVILANVSIIHAWVFIFGIIIAGIGFAVIQFAPGPGIAAMIVGLLIILVNWLVMVI